MLKSERKAPMGACMTASHGYIAPPAGLGRACFVTAHRSRRTAWRHAASGTCKRPASPPRTTGGAEKRRTGCGEVAEWFKAHAWNACIRETVSRVRIPLSPPLSPASPIISFIISHMTPRWAMTLRVRACPDLPDRIGYCSAQKQMAFRARSNGNKNQAMKAPIGLI